MLKQEIFSFINLIISILDFMGKSMARQRYEQLNILESIGEEYVKKMDKSIEKLESILNNENCSEEKAIEICNLLCEKDYLKLKTHSSAPYYQFNYEEEKIKLRNICTQIILWIIKANKIN